MHSFWEQETIPVWHKNHSLAYKGQWFYVKASVIKLLRGTEARILVISYFQFHITMIIHVLTMKRISTQQKVFARVVKPELTVVRIIHQKIEKGNKNQGKFRVLKK